MEWKDQAGLVPFNRIDVFDSRATALHVDGDLNYIYTPGSWRVSRWSSKESKVSAAAWKRDSVERLKPAIRFCLQLIGRAEFTR